MKKYACLKSFWLTISLALMSIIAWAQEKKVDVDITTSKTTHTWYAQPWVWVVGGAVFILLLVALVRNNTAKD